jgi:hypothetical protein
MVRAVVTEIYPVLAKARLCNCMARSAGTPWEIKDLSGLYRFWDQDWNHCLPTLATSPHAGSDILIV